MRSEGEGSEREREGGREEEKGMREERSEGERGERVVDTQLLSQSVSHAMDLHVYTCWMRLLGLVVHCRLYQYVLLNLLQHCHLTTPCNIHVHVHIHVI